MHRIGIGRIYEHVRKKKEIIKQVTKKKKIKRLLELK